MVLKKYRFFLAAGLIIYISNLLSAQSANTDNPLIGYTMDTNSTKIILEKVAALKSNITGWAARYHNDRLLVSSLFVDPSGKIQPGYIYQLQETPGAVPELFFQTNKHLPVNGQVAIDDQGPKMYYTKYLRNDKGVFVNHIYSADLPDGSPLNEKDMNLVGSNYNAAYPFLSTDGQKLLFSSDMPGGRGGMDIYMLYKKDGHWQGPVNLGALVNSDADDIMPTLDQFGNLFFSSSKKPGWGGYDLYVAPFKDSIWTEPRNLGRRFNSERDEYYLSWDDKHNRGWYSSVDHANPGQSDVFMISTEEKFAKGSGQNSITKTGGLKSGKIVILEQVDFKTGKSALNTKTLGELDVLGGLLKKNPEARIELIVHTDTKGNELDNQKLSLQRARECQKYLVKKGANAARIILVGYGSSMPRNKCKPCTEAENKYNRRVEIRVL